MYFKRKELAKFRSLKGPLIDVRSPSEYYKGHLPNSINIPLFDDSERSIIGTIYKKKGREEAVSEGLVFIEAKIEQLLDTLLKFIDFQYRNIQSPENSEPLIKIYCARGGMRSSTISWLLDKYNLNTITLIGGYKSYRKWVIDSFSKKWNIILIGGKTGSGKTKFLELLEKNYYQTIDLEKYACHRGSTFGGLGMNEQPSNEHFENMIAEKLSIFNGKSHVFVEAESANIGKCKIPHEFFIQMKTARRIELKRSLPNRLEELIKTYSIHSQSDLEESVLRIKKRLGPQRTKIAIDSIKKKKWDLVCMAVLEYYDKCYEHEKIGKKNIKTLDLTDLEYNEEILNLLNNIL